MSTSVQWYEDTEIEEVTYAFQFSLRLFILIFNHMDRIDGGIFDLKIAITFMKES